MTFGSGITMSRHRKPVRRSWIQWTRSEFSISGLALRSWFQIPMIRSTSRMPLLDLVRPKSSQSQPVRQPIIPSIHTRSPVGWKVYSNCAFSGSINRRKSTSRIHGSRISGYTFENAGYKSPPTIQFLGIRITRVVWISGDDNGT